MTITAHDLIQHLDDLFVLAEDNLVTTAHARLAGFGPAELRTLVRLGVIRRLIRGWYAVPSGPAADPPWMGADSFAVQRAMHRLLTTALVRSFEGRAVASHHSALVLHDVALWRSDLSIAHLARTSDEHSRHRRRAVIHPACGVASIQVGGVSTVPVAIAVVQVGLLLSPTGRRHPLESLVAADNALHQGLVTPGQLTPRHCLSTRGHRGFVRCVNCFSTPMGGTSPSVRHGRCTTCGSLGMCASRRNRS